MLRGGREGKRDRGVARRGREGSKRCVEEGKRGRGVLRGGREGKRDRCGEERKRREER